MHKVSIYQFSSRVLFEPLLWSLSLASLYYISSLEDFIFLYDIYLIPITVLILFNFLPNSLRKTYFYFIDKPAIIITPESIIDNINHQQYNWSDIFSIDYHQYRKTIDISVGELNTKKYVDSASWFLPRLLLKLNLGISHGTFHIGKQYSDRHNVLLTELIQMHDLLKNNRRTAHNKA